MFGVFISLTCHPHENLLRLMLAQSQVVAANFDFDRITQWREPHEFDAGADEQSHFEEARAMLRWNLDLGDDGDGAHWERGQRLTLTGHSYATLCWWGRDSTKIFSANSSLMARRALQTWQMTLALLLSNRIFRSSQKPSSRNRCFISGDAESCLMRTAVPAWTWVRGQIKGCWQPSGAGGVGADFFTAAQIRAIET